MQQTSAQYFKALTVLCIALIMGVIMLGAIMVFVSTSTEMPHRMADQANVFGIVAFVMAGASLFAALTLYKSRMLAAKEMTSLADKLNAYRAAIILFYALLEGPALFSIIAFFVTGDRKILAVAAGDVLIMLAFIPSRQRLIKSLDLSSQEADIINDPEGVIE